MDELTRAIEEYNFWPQLSNQPEKVIPTDPTQLKAHHVHVLYVNFESQLSPENLTCDGELSASAVQKRQSQICGAIEQLRSLGFSTYGYDFD